MEAPEMIQKKTKPPKTRRSFASPWGQLDYLCKKIRYWLYTRSQKSAATHYTERLERTLRDLPRNDLAIIREEGLALLAELQGRIREAIAHRRREIRLMEQLQDEAHAPRYSASTRAYMLQDRDSTALEERRAILEELEKQAARQNGNMMMQKSQ
jgi:hypothetical protein